MQKQLSSTVRAQVSQGVVPNTLWDGLLSSRAWLSRRSSQVHSHGQQAWLLAAPPQAACFLKVGKQLERRMPGTEAAAFHTWPWQ